MLAVYKHWLNYDPWALAMLFFLAAFAALLIGSGLLMLARCGC
jgi:hypothetical protein